MVTPVLRKASIGRLPRGAHLTPPTDAEATAVRELLADLGGCSNLRPHGPTYDERYLCATPQERVYQNGLWNEGLLPYRGIDPAEREQQQRFHQQMEAFKGRERGRDGRRILPTDGAFEPRC